MATNGASENVGKLIEIKGVVLLYAASRTSCPRCIRRCVSRGPTAARSWPRCSSISETTARRRDGLDRRSRPWRHGRPRPRASVMRTLGRPDRRQGCRQRGRARPIHRDRRRSPSSPRRSRSSRRGSGRRPDRPVRGAAEDRPLRRRRRRQDGADPGVDREPGPRARGRFVSAVGACARGQGMSEAETGDGGHHRQGRALLRADERAAGCLPPRRAVGSDDGGVLPRSRPGRAALHRQHLPLRPGRLRGVRVARPHAAAL